MERRHMETECAMWPSQPLVKRLQFCRIMARLHGVLTDAESNRIKLRIAKLHAALLREAGQAAPEETT